MDELTGLRDGLRAALSGAPAEGEPTAAELAERIKRLRESHQVEAAPARVKARPRAEAVRRREEVTVAEKVAEPEPVAETPAEAVVPESPPAPASFRNRVRKGGQRTLF